MSSVVTTEADSRGLSIARRRWQASGPARGQILIVHGLAEHSGRYERTAGAFAAAGFETSALDLPGFGRSGGPRAYVNRWQDYELAVAGAMSALADTRPAVLFGHSMGALVALTYVLEREPAWPLPDLLVLSGLPLVPGVSPATRLAAPVLARVLPRMELDNRLRGEQLSRDPAVAEAYFADPLVYAKTTARLGFELFSAMGRARRLLEAKPASGSTFSVPTLVLHGSEDTIALPAGSAILESLPGVERRVLPGLRHEIFNEPEGPELVEQVVAWIESKGAAQ